MGEYSLIHVVTGGEFATPLVASQVFDHAQVQAETRGPGSPRKVGVFVIEPMRTVLKGIHRATIKNLRDRCPDVKIHFIGGIGRLNSWPAISRAMRLREFNYGDLPVVYHCRGESAFSWGMKLRAAHRADAVLLDVRGAWPIELLYHRGIKEPSIAVGQDRENYLEAMNTLRWATRNADAVTTVSQRLKEWLIGEAGGAEDTAVVPCCVKEITDDGKRQSVRTRWGAGEGPVLLYSGTTASYQHVEDLVLPFMHAALEVAGDVRVILLTPEYEKMCALVKVAALDPKRTVVETLPQPMVREALTGADVGLLLRLPTVVNVVSQPTKVGEYLASGLPLVVEQGTGGVPANFVDLGAGLTVATAGQPPREIKAEARRVVEWVRQRGPEARFAARSLAASDFTWSSVVAKARELYLSALHKAFSDNEQLPGTSHSLLTVS